MRSGKEIRSEDEIKKELVETQGKEIQNGDNDFKEGKEKQKDSDEKEQLFVPNSQKYEIRIPFHRD